MTQKEKNLAEEMTRQDERTHRIGETYERKTEKLFTEWKKKANAESFVTDGVINPDIWFKRGVVAGRTLFLLKEAYGEDHDWDLAKDHLLTDEKARPIWKRVSLWAKGLDKSQANRIEPFDPYAEDVMSFNNPYLNQIAAINVKKYNGKKQSDYDEICDYAKRDKEFLKKQIELCDPTVIVCGYTAKALEIILDNDFRKESNNDLFYTVQINGHPVTVIDYWHPSNQYPEIMNYYSLVSIYQRSLQSHREAVWQTKDC